MAREGSIKKVFPGGNTSKGFVSFYDYIIKPDANKIFIIKGGPGVGKSTFMRKIAHELVELSLEVEFMCCSSDNGSLDGVVIPAIDTALIDGTAPHIVDPKNPGAVDEIVHLGDYWDEEGMRRNKEPILRLNGEVGRLFRRSYGYLATASIYLKQIESYYQETRALDVGGLNRLTLDIIDELFAAGPTGNRRPYERHLFATAITPDGPVNYLETIVGRLNRRYLINGDDGTGKTTIVQRLAEAATMNGYDTEVYHCALDPDKIDHVVIPQLSTAVINGVEPHYYQAKDSDIVIDTGDYVDKYIDLALQEERQMAREMYRQSFEIAVRFINRAKQTHDEMEKYFVPNMDFEAIEKRRVQVRDRIVELVRERVDLES
ncbi:MAG TPA: PRK06851 family protein [Bacillota bacterium]